MNNNTKKKFKGVVMKPNDKQFKNQYLPVNKNFNRNKNENPQRTQNQQPPKNYSVPQFNCYNCGLPCRMAHKCRNRSNKPAQVHLSTKDSFTTMITEVNLVGGSDRWWMDTRTSLHVYFDRVMFKTYTATED